MNRKNRIKLGALSRINDKILDRASARRYRLITRRRFQKTFVWAIAAAACLCLIVSGVLLIPLLGKQVPVYRGMTVSNTSPLVQASADLPDTLDQTVLLSLDTPTTYPSAVFLKTDNPNANKNGQISEETEEEIVSSLQVMGAASALYYAQPNQDIYITIHIDNPDQYEIQSFTLNGKKYSSYMFEKGSDMENLVLKVNVGEVAGYVEYTIDAIKYIDGTEIKDVRFDGDRTVRVGVSTDQQPTATVTGERIDFHSISFAVTLADPLSLISTSGGKVGAVLLDEDDNLLDARLLTLGENSVVFDNLSIDTTYRYGVVIYYDDLADEDGLALHIFHDKTVTTPKILSLGFPTASSTELQFSPTWHASATEGTVTAIELWQNGEKLRDLATDATSVDGLLSNADYTLRVSFTSASGDGTVEYAFTTEAKEAPMLTLPHPTITPTSADGTLKINDTDSTLIAIQSILLKNGNTTAAEPGTATAIHLTDLTPYTAYTLSVTYTYDLLDGAGVQTATAEIPIHTPALLSVTRITEWVELNQYVIYLDNPENVPIQSLYLNNASTQIDKNLSTPTTLFVTSYKRLEPGTNSIYVSAVGYNLFGKSYYEKGVADDASLDVYIPKKIGLQDVYFADADQNAVSYCFPSSSVYLMLQIKDNTENYSIMDVTVYPGDETYSSCFPDICPLSLHLRATKISGDLYRVDLPSGLAGVLSVKQVDIVYGNEHFTETAVIGDAAPDALPLTSCVFLSSDTVYEIDSAADLLAIEHQSAGGYFYYRQTADIDLNAYGNWFGPNLRGVYDGNGYKIQNMQHIAEYGRAWGNNTLSAEDIALFGTVSGILKNVTLKNPTMTITTGSYADSLAVSGLVGYGNHMLILDGCNIEGGSIVINARDATLRGITYYCDVYVGNKRECFYRNVNCTSSCNFRLTPSRDYGYDLS